MLFAVNFFINTETSTVKSSILLNIQGATHSLVQTTDGIYTNCQQYNSYKQFEFHNNYRRKGAL